MKILAAVIGILALIPTNASALTGVELYQYCAESKRVSAQEAVCLAYIRGFIDGMTLQQGADLKGFKVCLPNDGVMPEQGRLIFEKFSREHPGDLNRQAGIIFWAAMALSFQCPSN